MPGDELTSLKIDRNAPASHRRRRRAAKWIIAAVCLLILVAAGWQWVLNPVARVSVATVSRVYPSQTFTALNASGYVVAQRKAAVASKGTGRLIWLDVEAGSRVTRGQVIARLESDDLKAVEEQTRANRALAQSQRDAAKAQRDTAAASLDSARAQREASRANLDAALAELDDAVLEMERSKKLLAAGVASQFESDTAATRRRKAQAGVAAAEQTLAAMNSSARAAEGTLAAAESSLASAAHNIEAAAAAEHTAAVNTGYTEIRSPFDGVVLTKNADIGDMVTPLGAASNARAAVVTIADLSSLLVEADVAETNLDKVSLGQPCEVQLDSISDKRFPAVVHGIVPTADRAKGTVLVKVRFNSLDPRILPEMSAKVSFLTRAVAAGEETTRVAVSPKAVTGRNGKNTVFLVRNGRASAVEVRLGGPLGDLIEVLSGLSGGERIILDPPARLRDGARVAVAEG